MIFLIKKSYRGDYIVSYKKDDGDWFWKPFFEYLEVGGLGRRLRRDTIDDCKREIDYQVKLDKENNPQRVKDIYPTRYREIYRG